MCFLEVTSDTPDSTKSFQYRREAALVTSTFLGAELSPGGDSATRTRVTGSRLRTSPAAVAGLGGAGGDAAGLRGGSTRRTVTGGGAGPWWGSGPRLEKTRSDTTHRFLSPAVVAGGAGGEVSGDVVANSARPVAEA